MAKIKLEAERQGKLHQDEIGKIKLANQEAEQEMLRAKDKFETDSQKFNDNLVNGAADMVAFMEQHYQNLTAEQKERAQQLQHPPPPPYAPFQPPSRHQSPQPYQPPQQAYQAMPQQMPQQGGDALMAGAAAIAAGTLALGVCTIM